MNELDKWSAKACGIEVEECPSGDGTLYVADDHVRLFQFWTLEDARCMAVFEDEVGMVSGPATLPTNKEGYKYFAHQHLQTGNYYGVTRLEAKLKCAQAIMEASK